MLSKVPTIAINVAFIKENDSIFSDEMISQRLGMIPLRRIDNTEKEFKFTLDAVGPKTVYAEDLVNENKDQVEILNPKIIILTLRNNERISIVCHTDEGTGSDHAKWNPCCGIAYKEVNENLYNFHIETTGSLRPKEVILHSVDILKKDLIKYKKMLNN
jgi:DNA-directed RNA polymerase alpha subunit